MAVQNRVKVLMNKFLRYIPPYRRSLMELWLMYLQAIGLLGGQNIYIYIHLALIRELCYL